MKSEKWGGRVTILPSFPREAMKNYIALERFLQIHAREYKAIHVHANALLYVRPLSLAKKYGIPCRIIHSHSTTSRFKVLHRMNCIRIDRWVTHRFACSKDAGLWMFPNRKFSVVPNGIDIQQFAFDDEKRREVRNLYHISNQVVLGHVGRFSPQKNHTFIIDIFEEYHKQNDNSVLMLIGEGEKQPEIEVLVSKKGLDKNVIFTGAVTDVWRYLSAMDVFLFPSLWEGLSIALLEAQANNLPCLVSDTVPVSSNMGLCEFMSLQDNARQWAARLEGLQRSEQSAFDGIKKYDIHKVADKLEHFYRCI